jgi:hypothetical protein
VPAMTINEKSTLSLLYKRRELKEKGKERFFSHLESHEI